MCCIRACQKAVTGKSKNSCIIFGGFPYVTVYFVEESHTKDLLSIEIDKYKNGWPSMLSTFDHWCCQVSTPWTSILLHFSSCPKNKQDKTVIWIFLCCSFFEYFYTTDIDNKVFSFYRQSCCILHIHICGSYSRDEFNKTYLIMVCICSLYPDDTHSQAM